MSEGQEQYFVTDAVRSAVKAQTERLERELRGAWRAGYDYVHVYNPVAPGSVSSEPLEALTLKMVVHPSNRERPVLLDVYRYSYTYDLTNADDRRIREAVRMQDDLREVAGDG